MLDRTRSILPLTFDFGRDRPADVVSQDFGRGNTLTVSVCLGCRNNLGADRHID